MQFYCLLTIIAVFLQEATAQTYQNQLVVNCLNKPDNTGNYLVNTFYTDTSRGWRTQALRGKCVPGTFQVHSLTERVGYAWIKGESFNTAYIKVTSQQMVNGKYNYEAWSYKGKSAFFLTSRTTNLQETISYPDFPELVRCDGKDGRDKNGYCELAGPQRTLFNTLNIPYAGTVHDINLQPISEATAFESLTYTAITKGGAIYGQYWDYRNLAWNSDDCYTFRAQFSDGHSCEVTAPVKDFTSQADAKSKVESMLKKLGQIPKILRSWLVTIAVNGGGVGSRAGANSGRKSMTLNLEPWITNKGYTLFLHEGAHVGFRYIEQSEKWKTAQKLDPLFISTYAKDSPNSEDVAESVIPWMNVKRHPDTAQSMKIKQTIPNRLAVFDDLCSGQPGFC